MSLKEGFTVLRDQQFSADMNSAAVQRIEDVNQLRAMQFSEDAGPMSHPVRPASFIEISNFYTVTIYEKGAEVVGMIKTIVGDVGFRKGTDLYFARHDGQAVTTDDFVKAIEDANKVDLTQFKRWYSQAGTPQLNIATEYDLTEQRYTLTINQNCEATPGQRHKEPFHIPVALGLLDKEGNVVQMQLDGEDVSSVSETRILSVKENKQQFVFINVPSEPVVSFLRGFSAPVKVNLPRTNNELTFLMANDTDSFCQWDAGQQLLLNVLLQLAEKAMKGSALSLPIELVEQFGKLLKRGLSSPALVAKMLILPSESYLAGQRKPADVDAIHTARSYMKRELALLLKEDFSILFTALNTTDKYQFDAAEMSKRSLKNICLDYLVATGDPMQVQRCLKQMKQSDNMTDTMSGLTILVDQQGPEREHAIRAFYEQWKHDRQVVDKWLAVQAQSSLKDTLLRVKGLMSHPAFNITNPNNVRSLIGQFCRNNAINFHAIDGSGYQFLVEQILILDKLNPQIASRQLGAFNSWQQYDKKRQGMMKAALEKIAKQTHLSADVYEIVTKYLADT